MKVLISYASTEGQTRKIAERMALLARELGHEVHLYDTASLEDVPNVDAFDAVIVAASVHEEAHQDSAANFVMAHCDQLRRKSSAFISVSLSAAAPDGQTEAQHYVGRFLATTGWFPATTLVLGGALRWSDCDYFQRQVLKRILKDRRVTPDQVGNLEFTHWAALKNFIDNFLVNA